jgi:hypothetical protein
MPKVIQTMCEVIPDEGLLVRSAYLRNDIKASALIDEARRRAGELLARSEKEAELAYLDAKTEGYAAGILQAAEALTHYLSAHAELASQMQQKMQQEVSNLLQRCVNDAEVVMAAFVESLKELDLTSVAEVEFLLPERLRKGHLGLIKRLQQHVTAPVSIEYHQDARFLLRLGDHVMEFSPDEFVMRASDRLMQSLPSIYEKNKELAERCRQQLVVLLSPASSMMGQAEHNTATILEGQSNDQSLS